MHEPRERAFTKRRVPPPHQSVAREVLHAVHMFRALRIAASKVFFEASDSRSDSTIATGTDNRVKPVCISLDSILFGGEKRSSLGLDSHTCAKIDFDVDGEQSMFVLKLFGYLIFSDQPCEVGESHNFGSRDVLNFGGPHAAEAGALSHTYFGSGERAKSAGPSEPDLVF